MKLKNFKILLIFLLVLSLTSCGGFFKKAPVSDNPVNSKERARKNINEGKGISLKGMRKSGGTTYEFSTSNPLWRASLETLDFMPLTSVNYSGGIIITDWYSDGNQNESLKITIRFLDNKVASNSLKIIVHEKRCKSVNNCIVKELNSSIKEQLNLSILKRAKFLEDELKQTKK